MAILPRGGLTSAQLAALATSGLTNGAGGAVRANIIAAIGDSRVLQCTTNTATQQYLPNLSFIAHAISQSHNNLQFPLSMNFGVGGDTTTMVLARIDSALDAMVAAGVRYCAVRVGTNDIVAASRTVADTTTDLGEIYRRIRVRGITCLAYAETPRSNDGGGGTLSQSLRKKITALSEFARDYAADNDGVVFIDATSELVDYAATGVDLGDPIGGNTAAVTAVMYDGLHDAVRCAFRLGKKTAEAIDADLKATRATFFTNAADLYHVTDNPLGNLLTNGLFVGTGGALSSATGTVADSFTLQKIAGAGTVVGSKTTQLNENGTTTAMQAITLSGAATAKLYEQLYTDTRFTVGDVVFAECEVFVTAANGLLDLYLQTDAGTQVGRSMHTVGSFYWPDGTYSVPMRTPDITVTSNAAVTWYFLVSTDTGGSVQVELSNATWRHAD